MPVTDAQATSPRISPQRPTTTPRPNVILRLRHIVPADPELPTKSEVLGNDPGSTSTHPPIGDDYPFPSVSAITGLSCDVTEVEKKLAEFNRKVRTGEPGTSKCCHWDGQPFYTPPVHIPTRIETDFIHSKGAFCAPECAAAFIRRMADQGEDSHEQLALLNYVYGPIYNMDSPIQPASDPHGVLDCYGGPLAVQEYRGLFRSGRQIQALPKPLVKCVTEVHLAAPRPERARVMRGRRKLVSKKIHT
jgi:hypothetical protein